MLAKAMFHQTSIDEGVILPHRFGRLDHPHERWKMPCWEFTYLDRRACLPYGIHPGGRFHCWVYAREGNGIVVALVDPIRRLASHLPWWFTKYAIATPLTVPFYLYAKALRALVRGAPERLRRAPLRDYCLWIASREFAFFRHVAFDQLVTPRTVYVRRSEIESWLAQAPELDPGTSYIIFRNGNSWKFGGQTRAPQPTT